MCGMVVQKGQCAFGSALEGESIATIEDLAAFDIDCFAHSHESCIYAIARTVIYTGAGAADHVRRSSRMLTTWKENIVLCASVHSAGGETVGIPVCYRNGSVRAMKQVAVYLITYFTRKVEKAK